MFWSWNYAYLVIVWYDPCQAGGAWAGGQGTHFLSQLSRVPEMSWIYLASSRPRLSSGETQMVSCDVIVIQPGIWISGNFSVAVFSLKRDFRYLVNGMILSSIRRQQSDPWSWSWAETFPCINYLWWPDDTAPATHSQHQILLLL